MRRAHDIGLDAQHQLPGGRVDIIRLQPGRILIQHFLRQRRKEYLRIEQRLFRLDDTMNAQIANSEALGHDFCFLGSSPSASLS